MAHSKNINPFIVALEELKNAENFSLDNDSIRTDKLSVVRSFSLGDNLLPIQSVSIEENNANMYRVSSDYLTEEEVKDINKAFNYTLTVLQNKKLRNIQDRKKYWISLAQ